VADPSSGGNAHPAVRMSARRSCTGCGGVRRPERIFSDLLNGIAPGAALTYVGVASDGHRSGGGLTCVVKSLRPKPSGSNEADRIWTSSPAASGGSRSMPAMSSAGRRACPAS
jgi:hypothetical protein